ncbi:UDP-N-acetylmuramoyl-L-alanine--D-glutamate ligase [Sphingomonas sp. Xoc002]|uniref:UDP-N-acetylmuramoyl-L-alanine--D-glutamate ligase n=1 Tax=Sphingomonas sp. Xoc002 TaxID=2837624 RepID=UPI003D168782
MIVSRDWAGKRYAVLGLARSGAATVSALLAGGASVVAWDSDPAKREAFAAHDRLSIAPLDDLSGFDALVVSPGVPLNTHPLAAAARAAGVPVIGDIELFAQARRNLPPHKVVGITGTNGKSTTTALVHHILKTAGVPTLMGGNIGLPILGQAPLPEGGVYVLELSSYQIDLTQSLDCDVAVLLNITPDHLDRYDGFAGYAASKARLFAMQSAGHVAVVGTGDEASAHIAQGLAGRTDDLVTIAASGIDQSRWPALQGPHNAQNAQAAIAVVRALGIAEDAIEAGLASYASLPHRMQHVATRNGVAFVNDSKATNPESTAPALAAFPRVHWIVGGKRKGDDLDACAAHLTHVVAAYTIGEAAPLFFDLLKDKVPVVDQSGTLEAAVARAAAAAQPGDTVLLSPACASFDQFRDYEARGDAFRAAVEALA